MNRRTGFTIVELLVSLALIVLIMAVMSEAFVSGLESVSHLKATGDLQERLRVGAAPMRRDLLSRHFETDEKLSNIQKLPDGGFFRIVQTGAFGTSADPGWEGTDSDNIPSYRSAGCELHFTVRNPITNSTRRDDYFAARVPAGSTPEALSPTAFRESGIGLGDAVEVRYFLNRVGGETAGNSPTGLQLYSLHRRLKVIHHRVSEMNSSPYLVQPSGQSVNFGESACLADTATNSVRFLTMNDLACTAKVAGMTKNRSMIPAIATATATAPMAPTGLSGDNTRLGDDLVMTDVISFTVEVMRRGDFDFYPLSRLYAPVSPGVWEYDTGNSAQYDTSGNILPMYQLRGIKITMRIWDFKKQITRQITVIEEL